MLLSHPVDDARFDVVDVCKRKSGTTLLSTLNDLRRLQATQQEKEGMLSTINHVLSALKQADLLGSPWIPATFAPTVELNISFPASHQTVQGGNRITPDEAAGELLVEFVAENPDSPSLYTLISIDPDAPSRQDQSAGPWRHCILQGLLPSSSQDPASGAEIANRSSSVKRTVTDEERLITPWLGPAPPVATGNHRYMFLLYRETKPMSKSQSTIVSNSKYHRRSFDCQRFVQENGLVLVGATFFYCANPNQSKL